jgi:hypothetical protein
MGKLSPDHWTIAHFRRENGEIIKDMIKRFTKFLIDTGYAEGKEIVIDGTKLKANASVDSVTTIEELKERIIDTEKKIVYYLESINEEDEKEEELERLRKENEELKKRLEEAKKEKKKKIVKTDPDSNLMKTREGIRAAYNVQFVCETNNKLIITSDVSKEVNDANQLDKMYDKTREVLETEEVKVIIADSGYYVPEKIEKLEKEEKVDTYIATLPEQTKGEFIYDEEKDEYICQKGERLKFRKQGKDKRGRVARYYQSKNCDGCSIRESCTDSKYGRTKLRYINQEFRDSYRQKMQQLNSIEKIKLRKQIVEHPIGTIKMWLGKNPILMRGINKVKTEINIVTLGYNLLRIFNIDGFEKLLENIEKYNWEMA